MCTLRRKDLKFQPVRAEQVSLGGAVAVVG